MEMSSGDDAAETSDNSTLLVVYVYQQSALFTFFPFLLLCFLLYSVRAVRPAVRLERRLADPNAGATVTGTPGTTIILCSQREPRPGRNARG